MPIIQLSHGELAERYDGIPNSAFAVFVTTLRGAHATHYAAAALVVYDWLVTLDDEVRLIWGSPNTPPKLLYLFSRYAGLFTQVMFAWSSLFPWYCVNRLIFSSTMLALLQLSIEFSLMIRVYALWGQKARVAIFLLGLFAMTETSGIVMTIKGDFVLVQGTLPLPPSWTVDGCIGQGPPSYFHYDWVPTLVYETAIFVISCIKCLAYRPFMSAPLVVKMFLDGAVFYIVVFSYLVLTTVIGFFGFAGLYTEVFAAAVYSLSCSHLLLSIREYAANQSHIRGSVNIEDSDRTANEIELECRFANTTTKITALSKETTVQGRDGLVIVRHQHPAASLNTGLVDPLDSPDSFSSGAQSQPSAGPTPLANSDEESAFRQAMSDDYRSRLRDWIVA